MIDCTPAVQHALRRAQHLAAQQAAVDVLPEHLLAGLLAEEEGKPFAALHAAGVPHAALLALGWRAELMAALPELPHGEMVMQILRHARALAREHTLADDVSSELVLLALLRTVPALREQLEGLGLSFAALEAALLAELGGPAIPLDEPLCLEDTTEQLDAARILDANGNRAREALRVLEDYARFALEDAYLSRELKEMRHGLRVALEAVPALTLVQARDTAGDVGTSVSTPQEWQRRDLGDVVQANCKRLQEALRSLEEFSKLVHADAPSLEQLRYRAYTIEKLLLVRAALPERLQAARLYVLVTAAQCWGGLEWTVREAIAGGAQIIQLREKELNDRELLERARQVRRWTRALGALFIMNDRPDLARLAEADGVHVGQDELPVHEVRRIVGPEMLIGVSTHSVEQVEAAVRAGASYIGVGPTFPSATKAFAEFPGLEFVRAATAATSLPAFVIGGVTLGNLPQVLAAGGQRIAVGQALSASETPQALAQALRRLLG